MPSAPDATAPLRGASVGAMSALVAAGAHTFGGGMFPSETALVLLCLMCAAIGYATASMPVFTYARTQLLITLAAAQLVGHTLLSVVDSHHHSAVPTSPMLVAHVAAVALGAFVIRGAERGISRAVSALTRVLPILAVLVVDEDRVAPPVPRYRTPFSPRLLDLSGSGNRGPPALHA